MRKVVTGSQVAQLRNPDPFAIPQWRSPVYRTPGWIVVLALLARLLWRLMCFLRRHPLAVAGAVLLGWLYVAEPWPVLSIVAGGAGLGLAGWGWGGRVAVSGWIAPPARNRWRGWL